MFFSVDRIENNTAVLIDDGGGKTDADFSEFNSLPRQGMIYRLENGKYIHDEAEEKARKKRIADLQKNIFNK